MDLQRASTPDHHESLMTQFATISEAEKYAISLAKKSEPEDLRPHPLVSAIVLDKQLKVIAEAYRNEVAEGHAEYNLFEHKHTKEPFDPTDILLVTLEPCTSRSGEKTPCAVRVVDSDIQKVHVGLLDPNPVISGKCILLLQERGIEVSLFTGESQQELLDINKRFWLSHRLPGDELTHDQLLSQSLDEWYDLINRLYWSRNYRVSEMEILGHLVEVIGGLSLLASDKSKPGIERSAFVPKAIGWWLALCGRMGVGSPEAPLYAKYPGVCP
jgi:pyrimidine deaminase RibD-like protein